MIRLNRDPWTILFGDGVRLWILLVKSVVAFGQRGDWMKPMLDVVVLFTILWRALCIELGIES